MKQNELISYLYDFISQISDNNLIFSSIKKIILFGSAAKGSLTKNSDIDLFLDIKSADNLEKIEKEIKKELNKFETRAEKTWHLRDIDSPINVISGYLEEDRWKELKQEILSHGKILYGKFEEKPENLKHQILIFYEIKNLSQKNKMSLIRKLFGYSLKKNNRTYTQTGLIKKTKSEKLGANLLSISPENLPEIKKVLRNHKIKYKLKDIWTK